jgi:hypothetical protein
MSGLDRVIQVFPFRGSNTSWRRAGFVNHVALAPLAQQFPAWSLFAPARRPEDNWKRTWAGATDDAGTLGGPLAEWRTYAADEDPDRPCDEVVAYYTPTPSKAYAIRRDQPPTPLAGYDSAGQPVYYDLDDARSMMGGLEAERLVDCDQCPPHPEDPTGTQPRMAWLSVRLRITFDDPAVVYDNTFDARKSICQAAVASCWPSNPVLFVPSCGGAAFDPWPGICPLTAGCTWYNNKTLAWQFCGWDAVHTDIWWQGFLFCLPTQCQSDDTFIGAEFRISWSGWRVDGSKISGPPGVLGFEPDCTCTLLHDNRYEGALPECRWTLGSQRAYVYTGDEPCRPNVTAPERDTRDDPAECWGTDPTGETDGCTGLSMLPYRVDWSAAPS